MMPDAKPRFQGEPRPDKTPSSLAASVKSKYHSLNMEAAIPRGNDRERSARCSFVGKSSRLENEPAFYLSCFRLNRRSRTKDVRGR